MNNAAGKKIVAIAASHPLDEWDKNAAATATAKTRLDGVQEIAVDEHPLPPIPAALTATEKKQFIAGHEIYFREAHCATCHMPDGKGLDPAFPPLAASPWVSGDPQRLIKLTLHGMMGPFELKGKKFNGLVPMTPFGGMLKDDEIAAVLTYVRNNIGNKVPAVHAAEVTEVRTGTKARQSFYIAEELLKEHPLE